MAKRKKLKGQSFPEFIRSDVPIATRQPVYHWECEPRMGPEIILPVELREARARAWRAGHQSTFAVRCGDAWPPIRLDDCDFSELFEAVGIDGRNN